MLAYFALGCILLLGLLALGQLYVRASPRTIAAIVKGVALAGGALLLLLLLVTGRAALLTGLLPMALLAWVMRRNARRQWAGAGPTAGQSSDVSTRYLRMVLDHDSGTLSGEVTSGRFAWRNLADLTLEDLIELRRECADDAQSVSVLEAYLDRLHPEWRASKAGNGGGGAKGAMSVEDARAILGVGPEAGPEEIKEAHRRLMQKLHPDRGGSTYLAAQINRARDLLLEG